MNRLRHWPLTLVAVFVVTRVFNLFAWQHPSASFVANDISYYGYHLYQLGLGATDSMVEYPMPALWILQAIYTLGGGWETWMPWFAGAMMILDATVAASLYRRTSPWASALWICFTGAMGAIVWFRFDLIPAALVAWGCAWAVSRPRLAGALVGIGAAVKLWPALLAVPMSAPSPLTGGGRRRLGGFLFAGLGLAAASLITSGWTRSASPVTWQSERGLQIESVPASPLMFLRTFTHDPSWPVALSQYNAMELTGPGVNFLLHVATALTLGSFVLTGWLAWRLARCFDDDRGGFRVALLLVILTVVLATIVANKTLSPQYITWLGGPVAALWLSTPPPWLKRHAKVLAVGLIAVAGLTQYTYPWGTYGIMGIPQGSGFETSFLLLRNTLLMLGLGYATWLSWRATITARHRPRLGKLTRAGRADADSSHRGDRGSATARCLQLTTWKISVPTLGSSTRCARHSTPTLIQ
ncbi:MAG: glycosyltransferase 87 family protein [Arachnia sp.]